MRNISRKYSDLTPTRFENLLSTTTNSGKNEVLAKNVLKILQPYPSSVWKFLIQEKGIKNVKNDVLAKKFLKILRSYSLLHLNISCPGEEDRKSRHLQKSLENSPVLPPLNLKFFYPGEGIELKYLQNISWKSSDPSLPRFKSFVCRRKGKK